MDRKPKYRLLISQNGGSVVVVFDSFGMACQELPYKLFPETKELAKQNQSQEHGESVHIPDGGIKFKAYDLEAVFLYSGDEASVMSSDLRRFTEFLYSRNAGGSPLLSVYDEYTKIGLSGLYVLSVDNDLFFHDDHNENTISRIKVKFRVTDPTNVISSLR